MIIKKIISSKRIRYAILNALSWVPDSLMLSCLYWLTLKRWPNLKRPKRFSEWIQFYKIHYRNSEMAICTDKYLVRDFVKRKLGNKSILNKIYQVCNDANEINFDELPNKFVIKTTDGGNGDNVLLVRNKSSLSFEEVTKQINSWKNKKYYSISREWAYIGAKNSQIIIEDLLEDNNSTDGSIDDYKFLCFNGKFQYLWIDKDRFSNHCRGFWNSQFQFLTNVISDHPTFENEPQLPKNIREMADIAETLSNDFPFVRVDLYNVNDQIYFGEMTFYPWSGFIKFSPDIFDYQLGKLFKIQDAL